ncbi:NAD-dependent epimerase/dehydratase family protein [Pendulispora brunnea]|uniref:NAD-dependent epimerase/dehydratase family protein n=1 Tax=Pendulispora brunnea TaxID=2905690 RepID=A0ABZ2K8H3_9BACT
MGTVAVTGATGFIGSAVVRHLLEAKRDVRAIVEPGANTKNLDGLNVERISCDVTDAKRMQKALSGCESLYHLAAIYRIWMEDPTPIWRVNVEGTSATLLAAKNAGVRRVVYTSSIAAVGLVDGGEADETCRFNLFDGNDYIMTKWLSERVALSFAEAGLSLVVVNPAFPFGPRDIGPTPTGKIILSMLRGEFPAIPPGGICSIDVDDCAMGHLLAEEKGRTGERYILGNENVTLKELYALVAKVAGIKPPRIQVPAAVAIGVALGMELWADRISHKEPNATYRATRYAMKNAFFNCQKAKTELNLPTRPLEESVRRAIDWFRTEGVV